MAKSTAGNPQRSTETEDYMSCPTVEQRRPFYTLYCAFDKGLPLTRRKDCLATAATEAAGCQLVWRRA
jgi:hypothetical protein